MRFFFPLTVYCISLLSLQQALPAEQRPGRNRNLSHTVLHKHGADRLDVLNKLIGQKDDNAPAAESQTISTVPSSAPSRSPNRLPGFMKQPLASGARTASLALAWARSTEALQVERRAPRARRHAHSRGGHNNHHPKLMRVGCVLGTCQVQNLSHRLYQLIGQSGREDSSPINPRSPHSFG
uniref:Adrenomedullin 2a n=1 Tax=Oreochromis aureus TaxID=47969 RepID=A0AAZ1XU12_OREAU